MTGIHTCKECGQAKDASQFNKNSRTKSGLQSYCRDCSHKSYKMVTVKVYQPRQADVNEARSRVIVNGSSREVYDPGVDNTFYRNDGNKHVKSRGDRC